LVGKIVIGTVRLQNVLGNSVLKLRDGSGIEYYTPVCLDLQSSFQKTLAAFYR
jgi:hypothetical protein